MHLETLQLYCEVVRLRSFSRGAEQSFVSQSAASQAVQQLEAELGVALIDPRKRPCVGTPEGQAFYRACRGLLRPRDDVNAEPAGYTPPAPATARHART